MSNDETSGEVEYRPIPEFPGYRAGSDGSIWSCLNNRGDLTGRWKRRKAVQVEGRYFVVRLGAGEKGNRTVVCRYVHHLILETFVGPAPAGMQGCHDPDPSPGNNALANLRWDTPRENNRDKEKHGTRQVGEKNSNARLTADQVRQIRERVAAGASKASIGREFGVSATMVRLIHERRAWAEIE